MKDAAHSDSLESASNSRRKRYGGWRAGCAVALIALVLAFVWPDEISAVSPDGQVRIVMTATNYLQRVFGVNGSLSVGLVELRTGRFILVSKFYIGGVWDTRDPYAVIWHPDSRRFAYVMMSNEIGGPSFGTYTFDPSAHTIHPEDGNWLSAELTRRLKSPWKNERDEAEELLPSLR